MLDSRPALGHHRLVPWVLNRTAVIVIVVGSVNLAGCAPDIDCSAVGYSDEVRIALHRSMVDGRTSLRMCVDDQCNDEGELKGLPAVILNGTTLALDLPFAPNVAGPDKSIVRLIAAGAI